MINIKIKNILSHAFVTNKSIGLNLIFLITLGTLDLSGQPLNNHLMQTMNVELSQKPSALHQLITIGC